MIFGAAKFQVDLKKGGGGGSDLNVHLTLSAGKVNMSTAPNCGNKFNATGQNHS